MHPLTASTHGKTRVRFSKILRPRAAPPAAETHRFLEASVDVLLRGGADRAYTHGDNTRLVATDTLKNTVFALAKDTHFEDPPTFARALTLHLLAQYPHLGGATARVSGRTWHRLGGCPHAFVGSDAERRECEAVADRGEPVRVVDGLAGLALAKTTASSFEGFHVDGFRTLPDAADRVLATELSASWELNDAAGRGDFDAVLAAARGALLAAFVDHHSVSVQNTLHRMASAALDATDATDAVTLVMPNRHHVPVDLSALGRANDNEVFQVTDEPAGFIRATVSRGVTSS